MENFRDAELKKWLAEEYEKETEEMEKILFPDGVIPDDGETEEEAKAAYQRLEIGRASCRERVYRLV